MILVERNMTFLLFWKFIYNLATWAFKIEFTGGSNIDRWYLVVSSREDKRALTLIKQ